MNLSVRVAAVDEAPLVREIMLAAYAEYKGTLPVDSGAHTETVDDVLEDMRRGGALLAYDERRVVGSLRYRVEAEELYVWRVAVLPASRRRGVASAMMRFAEDVAQGVDRHAIRIEVRDSLPGNVGLYESLGYATVSIDPHPRGPDRVWTMIRTIQIPSAGAHHDAVGMT